MLQGSEPTLSRFESVEDLLAYLASADGDLDEKDQIYATLVRAVQGGARWAKLATALLWCGLRPGLDRVYRHQAARFRRAPDELVQEISLAFSKLISGLDLARVRRVAATLVRSTERELLDDRRRQRAEERRRAEPEASVADDESETIDLLALCAAGGPSAAATSGPSFAGELAALRARWGPVIGEDTDLVLAVLAQDADPREVAARLGLSYEAARKRVQRAVAVLRRKLQGPGTKPNSRGIARRHRREPGPGAPGGCAAKPVRTVPPRDEGRSVPQPIPPEPEPVPPEPIPPEPTPPELTMPSDTIGINTRCLLRTYDGRRAVLAAGVPIADYVVGDEMAEAYAMVQLVTQGLADQHEIAQAFQCSVRSVRRYQRRFEEGGLAALGRPVGYPTGRPRLDRARDHDVQVLRAQGKSQRQIAAVIGVSENAIREQLGRLGRLAAQKNLSGSAPRDPGAPPGPAAQENLSGSAPRDPGPTPGPAAQENLSGSAPRDPGPPPGPAAPRDPGPTPGPAAQENLSGSVPRDPGPTPGPAAQENLSGSAPRDPGPPSGPAAPRNRAR